MHPTKTSQPLTAILLPLYKEYSDLTTKLCKISDLITAYGGTIPTEHTETTTVPTPSSPTASPSLKKTSTDTQKVKTIDTTYPFKGTWAAKILFALKFIGKPSTVIEIETFILEKQPTDDTVKLHKTITQYTSVLAKTGDIGVDNSEYKNLYFLK